MAESGHEIHAELQALRGQVTAIRWMLGILIVVAVGTATFFIALHNTHVAIPHHPTAGREIATLKEQVVGLVEADRRIDTQIILGFNQIGARIDRLVERVEALRTDLYKTTEALRADWYKLGGGGD